MERDKRVNKDSRCISIFDPLPLEYRRVASSRQETLDSSGNCAKERSEREEGRGIFTQRGFMTFKLSTGGYTRGNREFRGYTRESAIITCSILSLLGTGL